MSPGVRFRPDILQAVGVSDRAVQHLRQMERWADRLTSTFVSLHEVRVRASLEDGGAPLSVLVHSQVDLFGSLMGRRLAELLTSLINALNSRQLLVAAMSMRGLIETSAAAVHCHSKVAPLLERTTLGVIELKAVWESMYGMIWGGHFDWPRLVRGGDYRDSLFRDYAAGQRPQPVVRPVRISTMLKNLDRRFAAQSREQAGIIKAVYAILSDILHPSAGFSLLQVGSTHKPDRWVLQTEPSDEVVRWFCGIAVIPFANGVTEAAVEAITNLASLSPEVRQ